MVSECYQGLNRWVNRTGMVHGAVLSGIAMSGDGIGKDELKYEHINAKKLGDLLSVQMFQDIVIDAWSLPLAYHSIEQMLSELSPWWLGQNQMHLQTKGLRGRSSLDQFINDLKQQLYVSKTGLFELELECLFFQAIYDPLPVKKNEFMISPSQIKVRAK